MFDIALASACLALRATFALDSLAILVVVLLMTAALVLRRQSPGIALVVAWVGAIVQMVALLLGVVAVAAAVLTTIIASIVPASRATRISPVVVLTVD